MGKDRLLPIKVVFSSPIDYQSPASGFGKPTFFGAFDDELRQQFEQQIEAIRKYFSVSFGQRQDLPGIAKLRMKPEALAKSHRPDDLFNEKTCPVVGANRLGELFVSVTSNGLDRLSRVIEQSQSQAAQANLTAIKEIVPFTADDAMVTTADDLVSTGSDKKSPGLRYRLFRHPDPDINRRMEAAFRQLAAQAGVQEVRPVDYGDDLRVFRVRAPNRDAVVALASFVGTQSLSPFPGYRVVRTAARVIEGLTAAHLPPPDPSIEYPVVGIIDSGTDPNNPLLKAWVKSRLDVVPLNEQDNGHGSFVAAILASGRGLNHNDVRFPDAPCRIVDVVALDKDGTTNEFDLLNAVDTAMSQFSEVKVWNLSLGGDDPCTDDEFSMLGSALDDRARKHNVTFVVAAGNYKNIPLRSWPADGSLGETDRICPPADAVRAITVGALAHIDTPNTRVRREEPSPFTRRGPGPAYLVKPELSHYGGNCDSNGSCLQSGIISVDGSGNLAEDIGTSFAAPSVSAIAGHVEHRLRGTSEVPASLVKALLVHSAFLRNPQIDPEGMKYHGIGIPASVDEIIGCTQSAATLIIQVPITPRPEFGKRPFPMPPSLITPQGLNCEIFMTLLYDPPLDRGYGIEYCRSNVSASLGTVAVDPTTGKESYAREVHPTPKELTEGYEQDLIKHGYKWSPLKLYYRRLKRGPATKPWRLTLELLNRAEHATGDPQEVTLIVTIRDPAGTAPVYDEMVQAMNQLNWRNQDLRVTTRTRV